jgi:RNA polymerase sigma factor (sigma-70 family)
MTGDRNHREASDCLLLRRFIEARDDVAFTTLLCRHGPMVLGVSQRVLNDHAEAEDVFQATFLVLLRRATSIRKLESLGSWLHGVAYRLAQRVKSDATRRRNHEDQAPVGVADDPAAGAMRQELQHVVDYEVERLPEKYRAPLVLCHLEGMTIAEAARQLGLKQGTLASRLARARDLLGERLARRGVGLSAGLGIAAMAESSLRAAVPAALSVSTIRLASMVMGPGGALGGRLPVRIESLTEAMVRMMLPKKVRAAAALLLVTFLTCGAGVLAHQALLPQETQRGADALVLSRDDVKPEPRDDVQGDRLPAGAVRRLGSRQFRIEGHCDFLLPTPDGKHVLVQPQPALSAYAPESLMLLDVETGRRVRVFEDSRRVAKRGGYEAIRPAAFSPDGQKLYALGWHKSEEKGNRFYVWANIDNPCKRVLLVWDVATGKRTAEWELPPGNKAGESLVGLAISPDGKRLFVYGAIRVEAVPGQVVRGIPGMHVLDAATGKKLQTWEGAGYPVAMAAGGKELLTFRRGAEITAHDVETGKPLRTYSIAGYVPSVALSPDGEMVAAVGIAGEKDQKTCEVRLWETATAKEIRRFNVDPKQPGVWSARLVFSADGRTLYLGTERILRWDLSTGRPLPDWPAHHGLLADMFLRPGKNELVSAGGWDGALRRWDAAAGKQLSQGGAYVGTVAYARTPDGTGLVAVDATGRLDLWDLVSGKSTKTLQTPGRKNHLLVFTPDGKQLLVAAESGPNTIWDLAAGKRIGEFIPPPKLDPKADEYYWATLSFSPDGRRLLASRFGRGTWMWTWPERAVLWHDAKDQECSAMLNEETLVTAAWHSPLVFRDLDTGVIKQTLMEEQGTAAVAFSLDGRRLVTADLPQGRGDLTTPSSRAGWRVRDARTGEVLKKVEGFFYIWDVAYSSSGWFLAVAGENSVRVYDTASWTEVARFNGHDATVRSVFFGKDDGTLISASGEDGTALVWSLKPPTSPEPPDPAQLWSDLAGEGPAILRGVWAAADHPELAVQLFREKWPVPAQSPDVKQVSKLIADLESSEFARREAATAELLKLGRPVEPELQKALKESASVEVQRRIEKILARWRPTTSAEYSAEDARELRAVWALELAGTSEAKELLAAWAGAQVGNRLCEQAAAALKRSRQKDGR